MRILSRIGAWWRSIFHRSRVEREMDAEFDSHVDALTEDLIRGGLTREEARRRARIEFGGIENAKEECRDARGTNVLESLAQDLRFGLRMLRKSPGFAAVAIITLALGIGANTAIFSVVNGVLLNPLPYPEPDRLVSVDASKANFSHGSISYPNFLDWRRINRCFSFFAVSRSTGYLLTGVGAPEELDAAAVTSDFFPLLGIKPVLGRSFNPSEDQIGVSRVAAISTDLWHRKFNSSFDVIGKDISLDGTGYTVVGVFPGHLDLPMAYLRSVDIYVPLSEFPNPNLGNRVAGLGIHGIARLKPDLSLEQARAEMQRVTDYLAKVYPAADTGMGATLTPMKDRIVGQVRGFLLLLLGSVGFVLLIVCVNIANLLLARGTSRGREVAVRSALGAGAGRLVRQMLTEAMLLAFIGGGLGVALAAAATRSILSVLPATLPRADRVGMDAHVLWFSAALCVCVGILFAVFPAVRTVRRSAYESLKERAGNPSGSRHATQGVLVAVQMALALVLLVGAGLLVRSLAHLWNVNPGFNPVSVVTFNLAMAPQMMHASPATIRQALRDFDFAVASTPGVHAESLSWGAFPMYAEDDTNFWIAGQPRPSNESQMYGMLDYIVGPDYLKAMRIPLLAGRFFTAADNENSKLVVVVDEALARTYFPNGDAVGKVICQGDQTRATSFEIVGVVGHVKQWGLDTDARNSLRAQMYFPVMQLPDGVISLLPSNTGVVVRGEGNTLGLIDSIRRNSRISKDQALTGFESMDGIIQASLSSRRFAMMLLGAFAGVALLLAGVGLYGVIAYSVSQRTQEMGVRMALGAQPRSVLGLVIGRGLRLALLGVVAGSAAALILARTLSSFSRLLFGVHASDPITFFLVSAMLLAVALLACYIPARRATKVDPMVALRYE